MTCVGVSTSYSTEAVLRWCSLSHKHVNCIEMQQPNKLSETTMLRHVITESTPLHKTNKPNAATCCCCVHNNGNHAGVKLEDFPYLLQLSETEASSKQASVKYSKGITVDLLTIHRHRRGSFSRCSHVPDRSHLTRLQSTIALGLNQAVQFVRIERLSKSHSRRGGSVQGNCLSLCLVQLQCGGDGHGRYLSRVGQCCWRC